MKIHYLSDIHLEYGKWQKNIDVNAIDADVSILAGDIGVGLQGLQWALSFERPVIYVMGNHEYYGPRPMTELWRKARAKVQGTHVHLLENESVVIDGVRFLGCTLWTDFCLFGSERQTEMMQRAHRDMNDYNRISVTTRRRVSWDAGYGYTRRMGDFLSAHKVLTLHQESRAFLEQALKSVPDHGEWNKTVVVTHHAPSALSLTYRQPGSLTDSAYASHLDALVEQANLWVHGHTHVSADYPIGAGRVVSNPRGYMGYGEIFSFTPAKVVEV
ncbi:MAG: metallophosphoesterase [Rhodocyclaceae bacterium]|nr:metallophosphoesterase [Rhodocyclaceae bacterium]